MVQICRLHTKTSWFNFLEVWVITVPVFCLTKVANVSHGVLDAESDYICRLNEGFTKYAERAIVARLKGGEELRCRQYLASAGWCAYKRQ